jgi:hypothetical protein
MKSVDVRAAVAIIVVAGLLLPFVWSAISNTSVRKMRNNLLSFGVDFAGPRFTLAWLQQVDTHGVARLYYLWFPLFRLFSFFLPVLSVATVAFALYAIFGSTDNTSVPRDVVMNTITIVAVSIGIQLLLLVFVDKVKARTADVLN